MEKWQVVKQSITEQQVKLMVVVELVLESL
jgi:hypothetical protein